MAAGSGTESGRAVDDIAALRDQHRLTRVLAACAEQPGKSIPLAQLMQAFGGRAHAMAMLILVLPETIPLPTPSIAAVLGVPLMLIAGHLALFGEGRALPARVENFPVPVSLLQVLVRTLGRVLTWVETVSRPRWSELARQERLAGAACFYLSVILLLPLPFVNLVPALCLALIALGVVQRDGIAMAFGIAGATGLTAALAIIALELAALVTG
jgi:hypothetical protein